MHNAISNLNEWWESVKAHFESHEAAYEALATREKAIHEDAHYMYMLTEFSVDGVRSEDVLDKLASKLPDRLCRIHSQVQSGVLTPEYDRKAVNAALFGVDKDDWAASYTYKDADIARAWAYIEKTYGGEAGQETAVRLAVSQIKRAFDIEPNAPVEIVAGRVVLRMSVYIDSFEKKYGRTELSYASREAVCRAIAALLDLARLQELHALATDLNRMLVHFQNKRMTLVSRERFSLGDEDELTIITYQSNIEFRLSPAFAQSMQILMASVTDAA